MAGVKKKSIFLILLILLIYPKITFPEDILVIQSKENSILSQLWEGIKENCPSSFSLERKIIPAEDTKKKKFWEEIKDFSGKLIFVLGEEALESVNSLDIDTPVIFGGVIGIHQYRLRDNFCGLDFEYSPQVILNILKEAFPNLDSIGIIYDAARSEKRFKEIKDASSSLNIKVNSYSAKSISDIPIALKEIDGGVNVFLMIMDPVVANFSSFQAILTFSTREQIPIFVPSEAMVKAGGFLGVKDDFKKMGGELFMLANAILSGEKKPNDIGIQYPQMQGVTINRGVGEKLGFKVSEGILKKATSVY